MFKTSLLTAALLLATAGAAAAATPDEVKKQIESAYPVQVLKVQPTEIDGRQAYAVRVMNKEVTQNGGLGIATLLVDAESGRPIPAFRHEVSGYTLPADTDEEPRQIFVPREGDKTWR
jgi:hypothetical protein